MAKLSSQFSKEIEAKKNETIRKMNEKEIFSALRSVAPCDKMPESIKNFLDNISLPRVNAVRLLPFDKVLEAEGEFFGTKDAKNTFACTVKKEGHVFPLLLLYDPEWSVKATKKWKVASVAALLKKRYDLELDAHLASIIRDELPDEVPDEVKFEGSLPRFTSLATRKENVVVGDMVVIHNMRSKEGIKSVWTMYIPDIDVKKQFASYLVSAMALDSELAQRISENWTHDTYVSVQPEVWRDAKKFASSMVFHGALAEGDTVQDLLQGEIGVVGFDNRLYLDIDDEQPSAVIIKGRLNVFVPPESK